MKKLLFISMISLAVTSCMKEDDIFSIEEYEKEIAAVQTETASSTSTTTTMAVEVQTATTTPTEVVEADTTKADILNAYPSFDLEAGSYDDYWDLFVTVAQLHGFEISQEIVVIEDRQHNNSNLIAWARARDIEVNASKLQIHKASSLDELVWIGVNNELFHSKNNLTRVLVMFHEFGHDYFNLEHAESGVMATGNLNVNEDQLKNLVYDLMAQNLN